MRREKTLHDRHSNMKRRILISHLLNWKSKTNLRCKTALMVGSIAFAFHSLVVLIIFILVQASDDGQAIFRWFLLFDIDYPTAEFAYNLLAGTKPMIALVDYWYRFGQGPNICAVIIFGIFGGLHWFCIGSLLGYIIGFVRLRLRKE